MKMYYSKSDLKNITQEELLKLTTFGGDNSYYYADLERVQSAGDEYSFHFKDNSVIYTQQKETFDEVKIGKARYNMLSKSLEENQDQERREQEFYVEMRSMLSKQMESIAYTNNINVTNTDSLVKSVEKETKSLIKHIKLRLDETANMWEEQIELLSAFDVDAYNIKMAKVDKIINAFSELLED